jgi:hypothetical protein
MPWRRTASLLWLAALSTAPRASARPVRGERVCVGRAMATSRAPARCGVPRYVCPGATYECSTIA